MKQTEQKLSDFKFTKKQQILLDNWYTDEVAHMNVSEKCRHFNIARSKYYEWQQIPEFKQELDLKLKKYRDARLPKVNERLHYMALNNKDPRWMKLWLEKFDPNYSSRKKIEVEQKGININIDVQSPDSAYNNVMEMIRNTRKGKR